MVESSNVQAKDIESIKELKTKYWRCVDNKLWDEVKECFTEDAVIDYPNGIFQGREAIAQSFKDTLSHGPVAHQGRNLEIELTSDAKAKASWQADVAMTDPRTNASLKIRSAYEDEYVKQGDAWVINASKMRMIPADQP